MPWQEGPGRGSGAGDEGYPCRLRGTLAVPTLASMATHPNSRGTGVRIGVHAGGDDPVGDAVAVGAQAVQVFLGPPQSWKGPSFPHPEGAAGLRQQAAGLGVDLWVHAPYLINVATTNNKVRIPSRTALVKQIRAAADIGALGLVVHGGQVPEGEDLAAGYANWAKAADAAAEAMAQTGLPVLIENTAGGDNSVARTLDGIKRLWDAVGGRGFGFCLDTCHAWAAGIALPDAVDEVLAITGRIDLLHCNNSRDEFGSHRDRHANINDGLIPVADILEAVRRANAPLILETAAEGQADDIATITASLSSP